MNRLDVIKCAHTTPHIQHLNTKYSQSLGYMDPPYNILMYKLQTGLMLGVLQCSSYTESVIRNGWYNL